MTILISIAFFFGHYIIDNAMAFPAYPNNMNWTCKNNLSYFVDVHDRTKIADNIDCTGLPKIKDSGDILDLPSCVNLVKRMIDDPNNEDCSGKRGEHYFFDELNSRCGCVKI
jgi:hypothetical protein